MVRKICSTKHQNRAVYSTGKEKEYSLNQMKIVNLKYYLK